MYAVEELTKYSSEWDQYTWWTTRGRYKTMEAMFDAIKDFRANEIRRREWFEEHNPNSKYQHRYRPIHFHTK